MGALPRSAGRARRPSQVRRDRVRRDLDGHVVDPLGTRGRAPGRVADRGAALDGHRAPRRPGRAAGGRGGGPRGLVRRRVHDLGGGELAGAARDARAARARARGGSAGPDPHGDDDPRPGSGDVRVRPGPARHRAAGLALVPPLPPRRVRRAGTALGPAGGRSLRSGCPSLRGDGHRSAPDQLPSGRARARNAVVAPGLHIAPARRVSEPRRLHRPRVAIRRRGGGGRVRASSRSTGATRARRSSAAAVACGRPTSPSS